MNKNKSPRLFLGLFFLNQNLLHAKTNLSSLTSSNLLAPLVMTFTFFVIYKEDFHLLSKQQ